VTYHPGQIRRNDTFTYKKGTPVYLLDTGDGKVLVMQLWTNFVNKGETKSRLLVQDTHEPRLKVKDENVNRKHTCSGCSHAGFSKRLSLNPHNRRMPRTYSSIEKIRTELAWVNETPDPNECGCRNV